MNLIKIIFKKLNNSITGGAIIIAVFSILAKILGLIRDRLLAATFGAGDILDAYYAAFKLPDLIFNTLVLGALAAAFIPVFIELKQLKSIKHDETIDKHQNKKTINFNHWQLSSAIMNIIFITMVILGAIVFIGANKLIPLIVPGFNKEKLTMTIELTRVMLLSIILFGISNVLSGILQSLKKFTMFALAAVMYNLGIIFGIVYLVKIMGPIGLAWGVVLGAGLHLLIQLPTVIKAGFRWQPILGLKNKAVQQIGKLMLPRTLGLAAGQINQVIITILASTLITGSLAVFNLAFNLQSVPIGIFAVSLAITAFPAMSESFNQQNKIQFLQRFSITVRRILWLIIPLSVFIMALRIQIVRLVLGSGQFDWQDTMLTANSLGFFAISLFAQGLIPLLARAFYAFKNTKIPVIISLVSIVLNIIGSVILAQKLGVVGLVIAFSIANIIQVILLFVILRQKIGHLDERKIVISTIKIITATIGAVMCLQAIKYIVGNAVDMQTFVGVFTQFISAGVVGSAVYFALSWVLGSEEIRGIISNKQ